jgi:hypothetical protein
MRFPHRISSCLSFLALALSSLPIAIFARTQPDSCSTAVSQPGDVFLQLSLTNGQTVFHEGEIIAFTTEYSSALEKKYYLSTRGYDRSGRLDGMEVFCINPSTGEDPLSDYFNGAMGFIGGGLGGEAALSSKPYPINLELNEWISLPPGSYQLSIVGNRAGVKTENTPYGFGGPSISLRSNTVDFQVVKANPEWQNAQLEAAITALDSPNPTGDDAKHAARVLRFLGSEAATRELAQRFWSGNDQPFGWDLKLGLFGSPYRATAIEVMKAALNDPPHPVTKEFVQALVTLEMQTDPKYRLPMYDEKDKEAWMRSRDAYFAEFNKRIADHMSDVAAAALQGKTGKALAVSVSESLQSDLRLNPVAKVQLRQMLVASWNFLSVRQRNELIQYRWEEVGGPELLPILRHIMAGQPNPNHEIDRPDRASALRRIYELAPDQGRELILREISNPKGDIGINVLALLKERELPQVEGPLIAKLQGGNASDVDFELLERYASQRVLPDVKSVYEAHRGEWACAPQNAMLRYFLKSAPDYGIAQVSDALGRRKTTGCYMFQLTALHEDLRRPKIEQIAIAALDDRGAEVGRDAAEALGKYGSEKAEAALWKRLEKFHEQWKDNADELRVRVGAKPDVLAEAGLGQSLVQAIATGQAWFATEDTIHRLRELASPEMQGDLDGIFQEIQRGEYGLNLNWWPEGTLSYSIGWYGGEGMAALKEKLAQLPSGTHLNLVTTVAERDRHGREFAELENAAAATGLMLQIQTPR